MRGKESQEIVELILCHVKAFSLIIFNFYIGAINKHGQNGILISLDFE